MSAVAEIIRDYVAKEFSVTGNPSDLDFGTPLIAEDIIDSLGIFILVGFLEERFGISIEPEQVVIDNFETIDAIARLVRERLGEDEP